MTTAQDFIEPLRKLLEFGSHRSFHGRKAARAQAGHRHAFTRWPLIIRVGIETREQRLQLRMLGVIAGGAQRAHRVVQKLVCQRMR